DDAERGKVDERSEHRAHAEVRECRWQKGRPTPDEERDAEPHGSGREERTYPLREISRGFDAGRPTQEPDPNRPIEVLSCDDGNRNRENAVRGGEQDEDDAEKTLAERQHERVLRSSRRNEEIAVEVSHRIDR